MEWELFFILFYNLSFILALRATDSRTSETFAGTTGKSGSGS